MIWNEILCLGDSITFGARDCYGRSYPAELGKILSEKTGELSIDILIRRDANFNLVFIFLKKYSLNFKKYISYYFFPINLFFLIIKYTAIPPSINSRYGKNHKR